MYGEGVRTKCEGWLLINVLGRGSILGPLQWDQFNQIILGCNEIQWWGVPCAILNGKAVKKIPHLIQYFYYVSE